MNQPPINSSPDDADPSGYDDRNRRPNHAPPDWLKPDGVAAGTWDYVHQRSIADHYDAFVADAALQAIEHQLLLDRFPELDLASNRDENSRVIEPNPCVIEQNPCVIDLGCGTGRTAIPLAKRGYQVVAVDLSEFMLARLVEKSATEQLSNRIIALRANLVELDGIADASADDAVCLFATLGMVQFRKNRRKVLRHIHRIVRPGGHLFFHVHHRWSVLREPTGFRRATRSILRSLFVAEHEFGDSTYAYRGVEKMFMHRFSRREISKDLKATGWQIDSIDRLSIDAKRLTGRWPICGGFFVTARRP